MKKAKLIYDNKEYEVDMTDALLEVVKNKPKIRPDWREIYWWIDGDGSIMDGIWDYPHLDNQYWGAGNGFFTEEQAEKELAKRQAKQRIKDWIIENEMVFYPDWSDEDQDKIHIAFHHDRCDLETWDYLSIQNEASFYFKTLEDAKQCIKECRDDWLILFDVKEEA